MALLRDEAGTVLPAGSRWVGIICLVGTAVALGLAINVRDGEYWPAALRFLTLAIFLCAVGTLRLAPRETGRLVRLAPVVVGVLLVLQFLVLLRSPPSGWNPWSNDLAGVTTLGRTLYGLAGVAALLVVGATLLWRGKWERVAAPILLVLHFAVGAWLIRSAPSPQIDVHVFQQEGAKALLEGRNPYAMTFEDIYRDTKPGDRPVYGEEVVRDGELAFGFPYPPVSLYLSTAGHRVAGDHRYAQLLAMTLAAACMAYARPGAWATAMAAMFLFTPRGFFVLGRGWTEPFVVMFLAATVFCACRGFNRLLPVALGLLLASKQYLVLAVPLVPLMVGVPFRWRSYIVLMAKAGGVAALVTLPFAVWNWDAFWNSLVTVQKVAPFREDALSYLVWFYHKTGVQLGVAAAFAAAVIAIGLALWRAERSPTGFAASVALVYLLFIALNKQAFANYYYFVIGALWCALAATPLPRADTAGKPVG